MQRSFTLFVTAVFIAALLQSAIAAEVNNTGPDCALPAMDGGQVFSTKKTDKVLYIDFWASWCGPCVKSFPFLEQLHKELGAQGLEVIGVNLDEDVADAKQFLVDYPVTFAIVSDPEQHCAKSFGLKGMPSSYLIGRDGVVRHVQMGFRPGEMEELRGIVKQLLTEDVSHVGR